MEEKNNRPQKIKERIKNKIKMSVGEFLAYY